ncbi:retrovirus-related pol polyprotein from transposon TNT 1-94 [Tanacetum coccineum]
MISKNDEAKMVFYNALPKKEYERIFIFNTIITSLKALDESFSSRNHVRKFLRALPSKWHPKVTAIEESKDLSKLSLDELVGNLKVYEDHPTDSKDKEYSMAAKEDKKEDRRCFKCGDPNHFISDCPKNSFNDQKAFVVGCWSDSGDDKEEICLMAHENEVLSDTPYYSSSSLDNESRQNEYDKLCKASLRIINKNKHLKAKNELLQRNVDELKIKLELLEKNKEISNKCDVCNKLEIEINSLKLKLASFENSSSSLRKMVEMQKPSKDKCGLGYTENIACSSNTKIKILGPQIQEMPSVESALLVPFSTEPTCSDKQHRVSIDSAENGKILESNIIKKNDSVLITKKSILGTPRNSKQPPILKLGQGYGKSRIQTPYKTTHRRSSTLYPKSNYHQVGWDYETQQEKLFRPPMYNQWSPYPQFPYRDQPNEPKNIKEAIQDESWTMAMQEELNQFKTNDVWSLIPPLENQTIIGTKWVFKNKLDKNSIVSRNKERLVAQGYNQQEEIDFDETYAPVARLESIRILLVYACAHDFKLFQMDVKSAFLNGFINEEVYVAQPPGFVDFEKPNHVFKLKKALYGLKQAPKAWYDRLKAFLLDHLYTMGLVDNTLFTKKRNSHIIIVQIYVDDIIFGSTCQELCDDFSKIMHDEFEMSMMGELNFFLGLQIKQLEDGIFFNQSKYVKEMLKKFGLEDSKPIKTPMSSETKLTRNEDGEPIDDTKYRGMIGSLLYLTASRPDIMFSVCLCVRFQEAQKTSRLEAVKRIFRYIKGTSHIGLWYLKGTGIETIVYADSDHARDYVDHKSTSGVCKFISCCLTSWFSKKQTALAISTTEAEYVSAGKACQQAL